MSPAENAIDDRGAAGRRLALSAGLGADAVLSRSLAELRAGERELAAMLSRLFDELDHRRLQLAEQSRASARRKSTPRDDHAAQAAQRQIAALERALTDSQGRHAQRLAELATARIELAAARIDRNLAIGPLAGAGAREQDSLAAELELLRSSAADLAGELAEGRGLVPGRQNADLLRVERLLAEHAGDLGSAAGGDQFPELLE